MSQRLFEHVCHMLMTNGKTLPIEPTGTQLADSAWRLVQAELLKLRVRSAPISIDTLDDGLLLESSLFEVTLRWVPQMANFSLEMRLDHEYLSRDRRLTTGDELADRLHWIRNDWPFWMRPERL